jgi:hypothetical protein
MKTLNILFLLACVSLIVGCDGEPWTVRPKIEPIAYAQKLPDGTYEIDLRSSVTSSGGPCGLSFKSWTSHDTNWLYVKSIEGVLPADQIVLKGGVKENDGDYTYPIGGLKGTVSFTNATMIIQLDQPKIDHQGNVTDSFTPYYLNGTYTISTN